MKDDLTPKQKQFCEEYLIDLNATQAAIRAGYSVKTANRIASENLSKPDIQDYICELKKKRQERTEYTQDDVIKDLLEIKKRCMQAVSVPFCEGVWKFDSRGANQAIDMLAKHIGFYETDNKQRATSNVQLDDKTVERVMNKIKEL
jgi:phage terminase small subunit